MKYVDESTVKLNQDGKPYMKPRGTPEERAALKKRDQILYEKRLFKDSGLRTQGGMG